MTATAGHGHDCTGTQSGALFSRDCDIGLEGSIKKQGAELQKEQICMGAMFVAYATLTW